MTTFVVGMGSNLGDRMAMLQTAVDRVKERFIVRKVSPVYETDPVGGPEQPAYLNAAMRVDTDVEPGVLLDHLLSIEASQGRVRRERWGPRTLDLDILWTDGASLASERLTVPHPRLNERRFALVPMLAVAPHATDPRTGLGYAIPDGEIRLWGESLSL